jgi:hypothetical protein
MLSTTRKHQLTFWEIGRYATKCLYESKVILVRPKLRWIEKILAWKVVLFLDL